MSIEYYEMRKADYTLRIANLDQQRRTAEKNGQILMAKGCERSMHVLEKRLEELEEAYARDEKGV